MTLIHTATGLSYMTFKPTNTEDVNISPIIFLHGVTRSKESWDTLPQSIADRTKRKVFVIDTPNHGDSKWTQIFNLNHDAKDVLSFMNTVNINKTVIIGHSMGGVIAMLIALIVPQRVEAVIIEDICFQNVNYIISNATKEYVKKMDEAFQGTSSHMSESEVKIHVIAYMQNEDKCDTINNYQDTYLETSLPMRRNSDGNYRAKHNSKALIKGLDNHMTLLCIPNVQFCGPTFFICGEFSVMNVCQHKQDIFKNFPTAKFIKMKHAGHEMHFSYPNEFVQIVISCMENI